MKNIFLRDTIIKAIELNGIKLKKVYFDDSLIWNAEEPYLSFIEENSEPFTLSAPKNWDGTLYYSTDTENWTELDDEEISSSEDGKLYLRGKNNTTISNGETWTLSEDKHIQCQGNIENLLDYEVVKQKNHPIMEYGCYKGMFDGCTSLTQAPELPAITLTESCYDMMFSNCTSLTQAPELSAITLTKSCYEFMFYGCTSLTKAPELPATELTEECYDSMFYGCTSLKEAPKLPAITLTHGCYANMFYGCTSLKEAPELSAIELASYCYSSMFEDCTSLTKAPELPATDLKNNCYNKHSQHSTKILMEELALP